MAIDFYDAGNGDGLFDLLGKVFHAQQVVNDARGSDIPTALTAILTQAENFPDSLTFSAAMEPVPGIKGTAESNLSSAMTQLQRVAAAVIVHVVNADNPQANTQLTTALVEMLAQMADQNKTVDACSVAVSIADVGSPAGDGVFVLSKKRGDGLVAENIIAESLKIECTADGPSATLRVTSDAATTSKLDSAWPLASGTSSALVSIETTRSLLLNSDFDADTVYANQPDDWVLTVGTRGTTILMTTIEQQTITIAGTPTGGYYLLHWTNADGHTQTTAPIPYNGNGSTVQSALRALKGLEKVTVTSSGSSPNYTHTITFKGQGGNVAVLTSTNRMTGATSVNEKQRITITGRPDGGTFTLTYASQTTAAIAYNASASTIATALVALSNIDTMTGTGGPMPNATADMEFGGSLAGTDVAAMTINTGSLTKTAPSVTVTTSTQGSSGTNEVQRVRLIGSPSGGTFTLSVTANGSTQTTGNIAYNANAAAVASALEALSNLDDVDVTGGPLPGTAVDIEFKGNAASTDIPLMEPDCSNLTGGTVSASVSTTTPGESGANNNEIVFIPFLRTGATQGTCTLTLNNSVTSGTFDLTGTVNVTGIPYDITIGELIALISNEVDGGKPVLAVSTGSTASANMNDGGSVLLSGVGKWGGSDLTGMFTIDSTNLVGGSYSASCSGGTAWSSGSGQIVGNYRLDIEGEVTDVIGTADGASTIEAIIGATAGVGSGNVSVTVHYSPGSFLSYGEGLIEIEFIGDLAGQLIAVSISSTSLTGGVPSGLFEQQEGGTGSPGVNEEQTLTITGTPTTGSVAVTFDGVTDYLPYNATASVAESILQGMSSIGSGNVDVTGGPWPGTPLAVEFIADLGALDVDELVVNDSRLKASITTLVNGVSITNETQSFTLGPDVTGGTFTLSWNNGSSTQTTAAIAWNATFDDVRTALEATSTIAPGDVITAGGPLPNTPVTVSFRGTYAGTNVNQMTGSGASLTQDAIVGTISTIQEGSPDSGSITHATSVAGTPQVYTGDKALILVSNGSELTCLHQRLTTLKSSTPYGFCLWACHDGNAIAAGVITIDLVDGISGTVLQDDQGTNASLSFNASGLTGSFKPLTELVAGGTECVFRTPAVLPDIVYLRVRISTAVTSTKKVFLDHLILTPLTELYRGGPWVACLGGADRFRIGDTFTLTTTNDRAGLLQEWFERNFGMSLLGLLLPSNSAGSETIPDSVVA